MKIAIIGSGAAGLSCAWYLKDTHDVHLFEKEYKFGGHANTFTIDTGVDAGIQLDVGFMVFNTATYPEFCKLLAELDIKSIYPCEMSFSYYSRAAQQGYVINTSADNFYSQK